MVADEDAAMDTKVDLSSVSEEELEAFVQVVVLVAYADGDLSEREEQVLAKNVLELAGDRLDDAHLQELMVELPPLSRSSNNWRRDRVLELKKKLPSAALRNEAFRLAVEVARSDDKIGLREGRMLVNIVTELDVDGEFVKKVLASKGS
jgi:tellurite resistance protein